MNCSCFRLGADFADGNNPRYSAAEGQVVEVVPRMVGDLWSEGIISCLGIPLDAKATFENESWEEGHRTLLIAFYVMQPQPEQNE